MSGGREAKKTRHGGYDGVVSSHPLEDLGSVMWVAVDPMDGKTLFICSHYAILTVSPVGVVSILAGGKQGFKDGHGREARFNIPRGIAVDKDGHLLIADCNNHAIRKVKRSGMVSTVAGNGEAGFADGLGGAARFSHPFGVALNKDGCLCIADFNNNAIRKLSPSGAVTTIAGNGVSGFLDGLAVHARFKAPYGIAVDKDGVIYVGDSHNHAIRKIVPGTSDGEAKVTTIAGEIAPDGNGIVGFADGTGVHARFHRPTGIAVDGDKTIIVSDSHNNRIRRIEQDGGVFVVRTMAGASEAGLADGCGIAARFCEPCSVVLDGKGRLLVAEKDRVDMLRVVDGGLAAPVWFGWSDTAAQFSQRSAGGENALALATALRSMLQDPDLTDVTFAVEGEHLHAHRCLLAVRSEFFRGLFKSGMQGGSAGGNIVIKDVSVEAFRALLHYLYTNELPDAIEEEISGATLMEVADDGQQGPKKAGEGGGQEGGGLRISAGGQRLGEILQVADRFQIEDMLKRGLTIFERNLSVQNAVGHLVWANMAGPEAAQRIALNYAAQSIRLIQRDAPETLELLREPQLNDVAVDLLQAASALP